MSHDEFVPNVIFTRLKHFLFTSSKESWFFSFTQLDSTATNASCYSSLKDDLIFFCSFSVYFYFNFCNVYIISLEWKGREKKFTADEKVSSKFYISLVKVVFFFCSHPSSFCLCCSQKWMKYPHGEWCDACSYVKHVLMLLLSNDETMRFCLQNVQSVPGIQHSNESVQS